jgi:hypothetical protein
MSVAWGRQPLSSRLCRGGTKLKGEYIEGSKATENFEQGMKALFKVSKAEVVKAEKRQKANKARASLRKPKVSDKD